MCRRWVRHSQFADLIRPPTREALRSVIQQHLNANGVGVSGDGSNEQRATTSITCVWINICRGPEMLLNFGVRSTSNSHRLWRRLTRVEKREWKNKRKKNEKEKKQKWFHWLLERFDIIVNCARGKWPRSRFKRTFSMGLSTPKLVYSYQYQKMTLSHLAIFSGGNKEEIGLSVCAVHRYTAAWLRFINENDEKVVYRFLSVLCCDFKLFLFSSSDFVLFSFFLVAFAFAPAAAAQQNLSVHAKMNNDTIKIWQIKKEREKEEIQFEECQRRDST